MRRRRNPRGGRSPPLLDGRMFAWRSSSLELHRPPLGFGSVFSLCGLRLAGLVEVRVEPEAMPEGVSWCTECWSVPPQVGGVQSTVEVPRSWEV